jgi:quercetin dioxygenase-like cupin family protein
MAQDSRSLSPSEERFVKGSRIAPQTIEALEGVKLAGYLGVKPMIVGQDMVCIEVHRQAGVTDPEHSHADHESICYLVKGKVRCVIDGEEFIAEPGDIWIHPAGVPHYHETLEDSVQLEFKSPPKKTWA